MFAPQSETTSEYPREEEATHSFSHPGESIATQFSELEKAFSKFSGTEKELSTSEHRSDWSESLQSRLTQLVTNLDTVIWNVDEQRDKEEGGKQVLVDAADYIAHEFNAIWEDFDKERKIPPPPEDRSRLRTPLTKLEEATAAYFERHMGESNPFRRCIRLKGEGGSEEISPLPWRSSPARSHQGQP